MGLRNFNTEKYLKDGETTYAQRAAIEKMADELTERGYDNIVAIGIGGTWAEWYPVVHYMKHKTDLPVYLCNAAELLVREDRRFLSRNSLVVTASASGDTKEIIEAVKMCKEEGIEVCGFTKDAETPLAKLLDRAVYNACGVMFGLRLLFRRGEFDEYTEWADQMKNLHSNLLRFREEFEADAAAIAKKYARKDYNIFVGSGILWGETYLFSMCILEEMQWVRTKSVTSADFFHGTLELVEDGVPVFLFKGVDEYRPLDERVERFAKEHTDMLTVVDIADYRYEGIDEKFRVICSPMVLTALATERLAAHYELNTGHSLQFRRYYRQFEY